VRRVAEWDRNVVVLTVLIALLGCGHSEDRTMKRPVHREELIGTWRLDETGMVGLRDAGYKTHLTKAEHTLDLQADGGCHIRTFRHPKSLDPAPLYIDSPCRWRITNVSSQLVEFDVPGGTAETFQVAEEHGHLLLWQYLDDPDQWRYVEFARVGAAGAVSERPQS
jgi:hypothetical protein